MGVERSMSGRRFLIIASYAPSFGRFRGRLIQAINKLERKVHLAAPDLTQKDVSTELVDNSHAELHRWSLARAGVNPVRDLASALDIWRIIRLVRPGAVLAYTIKPIVYGLIAARIAGVPRRYALVTGAGFALSGRRTASSVLAIALYRLAFRCATKVFFQNRDDLALFREKGIVTLKSQAVVVNGSGVDLVEFSRRPIPGSPVVFLMIARLLIDKGVREYAAAAKLVKKRWPDARFRLAGWLDDNPSSIGELGLKEIVSDGDVEFLGRLDDVRDELAAASVFVLPSYREGTPRTVLEAMAVGRAIITTDAPGCRETVQDGENGFLVPVGSVDALVEAMHKFLVDQDLVEKMGLSSRELVERKYDVRKVNEMMLREMGIVTGVESSA